MSKSNQIQLSDHFTTGRLLKFTASPIIMMIFTSIYTIVDGFFVSNCAGKTAFTALNLIYPYLQMLGCLGFMIGTGGSALVAMTLGMGDEKRANRLFSMLAVATVGIGAIFSVIGLALLRPVALLLGATPELLPSCLLYGRILLTFQTAFMLQYLFQSFFIAAEKPKLGLCIRRIGNFSWSPSLCLWCLRSQVSSGVIFGTAAIWLKRPVNLACMVGIAFKAMWMSGYGVLFMAVPHSIDG